MTSALKTCRRCGATKPATPEYFYRDRRASDGLMGSCKACQNAREADYRRRNPDAGRIAARNWRAAHPEAHRQQEATRRARLKAAPGSHTRADELEQKHRQKNRCYYCGAKLGNDWTIDHVIPITRGGSDSPDNLVACCPTCNRVKYNRAPHEVPALGRLA